MKKLLISTIIAALLCTSLLSFGLIASAETLSDKNLGMIDITASANVTDVKGTETAEVDNPESARRVMGKGDTFSVSATFGPSELNRYAYLRVEAEGNRKIEISTDNGAKWATIGSKEMAGVYGATVRGEDHRGIEDSQATFYDISKFVPVETGAAVKIRFSTPADAQRSGVIFKNFKIFRAPTFDFSDGNMTETVDLSDKDKAQFFDFHRAKMEGEGPKADGWAFYMWRILVPAGATDAHVVADLGFDNRAISVVKADGSAETKIGWKDHENGKEGAVHKTDPHPVWKEGLLHYSLKDYLNTDGTATPLVIKMRPNNLGGNDGPQTKKMQFSYTTEKQTSSSLVNRGVEDVVNVYELKKDNKTDSPYFVADTGITNQPENNTYYDNNESAVYKLPYRAGVEKAVLRARVRGYYRLSVSTNNGSWQDVAIGDLITADGSGPRQSDVFFDVTDFVNKAEAGHVFVRFADNTPMNGHGPKWEMLGLDCDYGDASLSFVASQNKVAVDLSSDAQVQDRWGAAFTADGAHRFADGSHYFTYSLNVPAGTEHLHMQAKVGGANRKIEVSTDDGATWKAIDDAKQDVGTDVIKTDGAYYNLKSFLKTGGTKISVRFGCNDAGSGADLNTLAFVKGQDFAELETEGSAIVIDDGVTQKAVHVEDEKLMWKLNGTAGQSTSFGGGYHRFADTTSFFAYKVEFLATQRENVYLKVDLQGTNRHLEVSSDGKVWTNLSYIGINDNDPLYGADLIDGRFSYFKLDEYLTDTNVIYVKFSAYDESRGNGADVYSNIYFLTGADIFNGEGKLTLDQSMVQNVNLSDRTLIASDNGSKFGREGDSVYRNANGTESFTYRLQFSSNTEFAYAMIRMKDTANRLIEVSSDGVTYKPLSYKNMESTGGADGASYRNGDRYYFSLDKAFRASETGSIWLRFGAKDGGADGIILYEMLVFYSKAFNDAVAYPDNAVVNELTMVAGAGEDGYFQPKLSNSKHDTNFDGDGFRFYDSETYGVYKFVYDGSPTVLKLIMEVRGGYRVSVSADAMNWTDILISNIDYAPDGAPLQNRAYHDFNLTAFLNDAKTIYVKVGDSTDYSGWGGALSRITLLSVSGGGAVAKQPVFAAGELSKQVKLQDASYLHAESGSTFEFTGRGVKGASAYFTYKFELSADATSFFLAFNNKNAIKADISKDGTTFEKVPDGAILNSEYGKGSAVTYDLGYFLENSKTVYVRFMDGNAGDNLTAILLSLYAGYNSAALSDAGKYYADEKHDTFIVGTAEETAHTVTMDSTNIENRWEYRSIKKNARAIYKFKYEQDFTALKLKVSVGGTFKISVSTDGVNFTDRLVSTSQFYAQSGREEECFYATAKEYTLDISSLMTDNAARTIYVKVSDPIDDNDFGAQLVGLGLVGMDGKEVPAPKPEKPYADKGCGSSVSAGAGLAGLVLLLGASLVMIKKAKKHN